MRTKVQQDPIVTGGTAALAGLWLTAPDFWAWVASHFRDGGIIVPALSAAWLAWQLFAGITTYIERRRDRRRD